MGLELYLRNLLRKSRACLNYPVKPQKALNNMKLKKNSKDYFMCFPWTCLPSYVCLMSRDLNKVLDLLEPELHLVVNHHVGLNLCLWKSCQCPCNQSCFSCTRKTGGKYSHCEIHVYLVTGENISAYMEGRGWSFFLRCFKEPGCSWVRWVCQPQQLGQGMWRFQLQSSWLGIIRKDGKKGKTKIG